jgi:hypothetical protein
MITHAKNTMNGERKLSKDVRSLAVPFDFTLNSTKYTCIVVTVNTTGHLPTRTDGMSRSMCVHLAHLGPTVPYLCLLMLYFHRKVPSCPRQGSKSRATVHHGEGTAKPGTETLTLRSSSLLLLSIACS